MYGLSLFLFLIALILLICTLWALASTPTASTSAPITPLSIEASPLKEAPFPCYLMILDGSSPKYLTDADGIFNLTARIEEANMYTYHRGHGDFLKEKGYHKSISKYWDSNYLDSIDFLEGPDYIIELNYVEPYNAQALIRTLVQDPAHNLYLMSGETGITVENEPLREITVFTIPNYIYNYEF
jgi:hypothetical protein